MGAGHESHIGHRRRKKEEEVAKKDAARQEAYINTIKLYELRRQRQLLREHHQREYLRNQIKLQRCKSY